MIKVECPGCKAPYQVDERRVPDAGLKMRCPKCATSFVVTKPGAPAAAPKAPAAAPVAAPNAGASAGAPRAIAPRAAAPAPAAPKAAPPRGGDVIADAADWDLPAPGGRKSGLPGAPPAARKASGGAPPPPAHEDDDDVDLPIVANARGGSPFGAPARGGIGAPPQKAAAPARGFGEIDLLVDLPEPTANDSGEHDLDLPIPRGPAAGARGAPPAARPGAPPKAPPAAARNTTQLFGDTVPDPAATPHPPPSSNSAPIKVPVPARGAPAQKPAALRPSEPDHDLLPAPATRQSSNDFGRSPFGSVPDLSPPPPPAQRAAQKTVPKPPPPPVDDGLGFGELDLPLLASGADLPSTSFGTNLPSPAAGLPTPAAGLPTPVEGGALPAKPTPGLPMPTPGTTLPVATPGTTLPTRARTPTPTPLDDRLNRLSAPDLGDGPAVHGPGFVAGADLYTGPAAYDDRHMDPAFQTSARNVGTSSPGGDRNMGTSPNDGRASTPTGDRASAPTGDRASSGVARAATARNAPFAPDPEEAPFMTTSGAPVRRGAADARGEGPRNTGTTPMGLNARGGRVASQPSMGDLIDRTSIELDLVEPPADPNPMRGGTQPMPPQPTPLQVTGGGGFGQRRSTPNALHAQSAGPMTPAPMAVGQRLNTPGPPMSVPDLAMTPDGTPPPPRNSRFEDPLDPNSGVFGSPDAGTEASLGSDDVGDEADLDARHSRGVPVNKTLAKPDAAAKDEAPKKKKPWMKIVVAAGVVGLFAGAMAGFVPDIGPFGLNFVSDRVNAKLQNGALDTARDIVQADLEGDTSAGADRALAKVKTAQAAYPRHRATAGYAAFVAFSRGLRFGARAEDRAYGDMMVRVSSTKPSDFLLLGQAAQDASAGQIAKAQQTCKTLLQRMPDDLDVAVLAGEVELLAKGESAVKIWQHAVDIKKSPRTLFGLARAQFQANDMIGTEASAKNALDMAPKHVGARTLLAQAVWANGNREQQALELLAKVTEDGEIRSSAGEPELVAAYTALGNIHLAKSRMTQAEAAFAAALKIDPQAVAALVGNGELFYRSGRYSEAVARYEAATRADGESVPAKIGMAKTLLSLERGKEAKDLLKKLCESKPNEPLAFYWLGRSEESLGNKKEAEAAYTSAIKVGGDKPQTVEAYVALAQLLSSLGRIDDANARLAEAGNRFPGLPALHRARGDVALATGNFAEAKKEYETALGREDDLGTKFKLGSTLRRMRMFDDAAKFFDSISESDKDFPGLALERGLLFEETGQSERATEMYAKALQSAPNDLDLKLRVGSTQVMAGHAKQAEAILRDVFKAKPNSAEVNHFLGRALLVRGNFAEAKRFLERAAEIDPNRAEYHLYVGWIANELGDMALAESALKRSIELDRNLGDAYWQRAVLLQKQGQSLDALSDLKIALEKSPSRFEIYATMASCYQDQSKWPEAEEAWRKAIAGNGDNAEWHYRLGKTYVVRNNRTGATAEFDKAVELAEQPDKATPGWLAQAHLQLGEAYRATNKEKAKHSYERYLALAPQNDPYRDEAQKALDQLNGH
ncbi:MAG: tetratricopeptide repeat protein [Polyangiaceae bacterium]